MKGDELFCVRRYEERTVRFTYVLLFIIFFTTPFISLLFFILLRFVLCSNHALHSFPLVFEQSTKKKKRNEDYKRPKVNERVSEERVHAFHFPLFFCALHSVLGLVVCSEEWSEKKRKRKHALHLSFIFLLFPFSHHFTYHQPTIPFFLCFS